MKAKSRDTYLTWGEYLWSELATGYARSKQQTEFRETSVARAIGRAAVQKRFIQQAIGLSMPLNLSEEPLPSEEHCSASAAEKVLTGQVHRCEDSRTSGQREPFSDSGCSLCISRDTGILSPKNLLLTSVKHSTLSARALRRHTVAAQRRYIASIHDVVGAGSFRFASLCEVFGIQRPALIHVEAGKLLRPLPPLQGRIKHFAGLRNCIPE